MTMNTITTLFRTSSLLLATILQCCYYPRKKVLMEIGPITFKHIIIILNSRVIFCFNWKGHASSSKPRWHQFPVKETFMLSVFYLNVNLQSLKDCSKCSAIITSVILANYELIMWHRSAYPIISQLRLSVSHKLVVKGQAR